MGATSKHGCKCLKKQGLLDRHALFGSKKLCSKFNPVLIQVKSQLKLFDYYCMYRLMRGIERIYYRLVMFL